MVAALRGRRTQQIPLVRAFQPVATRLVTSILFAVLVFGRTDPSPTTAIHPPLAQMLGSRAVLSSDLIPMPTVPSQNEDTQNVATTMVASNSYTVARNDTLWSIAESQLGDPTDWPAIAVLNLGRTMDDGRHFVDPNLIYPGWVLQLPSHGPVAPSATDVPASPSTSQTISSSLPTRSTPNRHSVSSRDHPAQPKTSAQHGHRAVSRAGAPDLPELITLGIGAIGCAVLARRSRRIRTLRHVAGHERPSGFELSDSAVDTDVLLARFGGIPALRAFELANCLLAEKLSGTDAQAGMPGFRAICVGPAGVSFLLQAPTRRAPDGFTISDNGTSWDIPHESIPPTCPHSPLFRMVLPVGEDGSGTWLVPLQPGDCLPILGEAANDLLRAAIPVQKAWTWADAVIVTDDATLVERELQWQADGIAPSVDGQQILFVGQPEQLSLKSRQRVAVVTTSNDHASDVTVLVDRHLASIHPLGKTLRPHLFDSDTARNVDELVSEPLPDSFGEQPTDPIFDGDDIDRAIAGDVPDPSISGPGIVEVRMLTTSPRLEGLRDTLPPNRARRATELVAYLALHSPDPVTSDRLRTRVLGSSDADAASKTLFNTATAARRAMGQDLLGNPLLPLGSRTGLYQVADAVTSDVQRATDLAALGGITEDPETAIALLRESLALVEGEPLANTLSGYTWWESEGHSARIAAVLINAACNLAALAIDAELFDLARWGLGQARLVDPYSEAISRAAMQVAAAAGDADHLRREWRECQRRMDDLDPGSSPSPRTERLYGELCQRLLVSSRAARHE
ncbi:MAG TPA: LysM peptidoglycan-binding domain-containing protein [Acidimicrobiales bacterium]